MFLPLQFNRWYAYLVCCAGSRGECWPTMNKMSKKLGIAMSTVQDRINLLEKKEYLPMGNLHEESRQAVGIRGNYEKQV